MLFANKTTITLFGGQSCVMRDKIFTNWLFWGGRCEESSKRARE